MCFETLPIEFDAAGNATLKEGVRDPYGYETQSIGDEQDRLKQLLAQNGYIKSVDFDPVTRVAGALAFHSDAFSNKRDRPWKFQRQFT